VVKVTAGIVTTVTLVVTVLEPEIVAPPACVQGTVTTLEIVTVVTGTAAAVAVAVPVTSVAGQKVRLAGMEVMMPGFWAIHGAQTEPRQQSAAS
jgi:hypothetical protein